MLTLFKNKETLLKQKIAKILEVDIRHKKSSKGPIKSIALITTDDILQEVDLQKLTQQIFDVKAVSILAYKKFQKDADVSDNCFTEKDITKNGEILNDYTTEFLTKKYDVLIAFFDSKNTFMEYASVVTKARYKVGFTAVNRNAFDVEIAGEVNNPQEFLSEAKKYITILSNS